MMEEDLLDIHAPGVRAVLITNTESKERTAADIFQEHAEFEQARENLGVPEIDIRIPGRGEAKYGSD